MLQLNYKSNQIDISDLKKYVNVTQMANACGKKVNAWLVNNRTSDLIKALAEDLEIIETAETLDITPLPESLQRKYYGLVHIIQGGNKQHSQGTWVHPDLAVDFAMWCSPKFGIWASKEIRKILQRGFVSVPLGTANLLREVPLISKSELLLSYRIKAWLDLCGNYNFYVEHPIINTVNTKSKTRRIDFIKRNGRNVEAYELKLGKVTLMDVAKSIGSKDYINLCRNEFNCPVKFYFISPSGIDDKALTLINQIKNCYYISVSDFCNEYYNRGLKTKWKTSQWYLAQHKKSEYFCNLFDKVKEDVDF